MYCRHTCEERCGVADEATGMIFGMHRKDGQPG